MYPLTAIIFIIKLQMNYLHAAIIEDFEECLISASEDGLREQVNHFLTDNSLIPLTDVEWAVCIVAKTDEDIPLENLAAIRLITYYKVESRSEKVQIMAKLNSI